MLLRNEKGLGHWALGVGFPRGWNAELLGYFDIS